MKTEIEGSYSVSIIRNGESIFELPRQKNLILQNAMQSLNEVGNYIQVGTGSAEPVFSDSILGSFLASQAYSGWVETSAALNGSIYERESSTLFTFAVGAVVGNISELGISTSSTNTTDLRTRALFRDGLGDPVVISVTSQDQLVITYFIKKNIDMTPTVSSVVLNGNTINYTIRPFIGSVIKAGSPSNYPASIYQEESGNNIYMNIYTANKVSVDPVTFIPTDLGGTTSQSPEGSSVVTLTASGNDVLHTVTFPINIANFQWISATVSTSFFDSIDYMFFQIEFDGPNYITKNNTETVTFKIKEIVNQVI